MTRTRTTSEPVVRIRIDHVVMDADTGPENGTRAALLEALRDAVQRHLQPPDTTAALADPARSGGKAPGNGPRPGAEAGGLDSAGRAVAVAVRAALASRLPRSS